MVRRFWLVCLAMLGTPALAAPDWRAAGGDLFVATSAPSERVALRPDQAHPTRLQPPTQPFADAVSAAAELHGVDPKLLHALVTVESAYQPDAVSRVGAAGLTQLMPATAQDLGVRDRFDPSSNLRAGAAYLSQQLIRFGDLRLALAAYNAGPARVAQLGRIPDVAETRTYVHAVVECYLALSAGRGVRSAPDCRPREATP